MSLRVHKPGRRPGPGARLRAVHPLSVAGLSPVGVWLGNETGGRSIRNLAGLNSAYRWTLSLSAAHPMVRTPRGLRFGSTSKTTSAQGLMTNQSLALPSYPLLWVRVRILSDYTSSLPYQFNGFFGRAWSGANGEIWLAYDRDDAASGRLQFMVSDGTIRKSGTNTNLLASHTYDLFGVDYGTIYLFVYEAGALIAAGAPQSTSSGHSPYCTASTYWGLGNYSGLNAASTGCSNCEIEMTSLWSGAEKLALDTSFRDRLFQRLSARPWDLFHAPSARSLLPLARLPAAEGAGWMRRGLVARCPPYPPPSVYGV